MPDSCQTWLWRESAPGSAMSSATLTLVGCPFALHPASVSATAVTPHGFQLLRLETITTTSAATSTRVTVRVQAAPGAPSPAWSLAEKGSGCPWPTVILWARLAAETATGMWAITTVTFWTARWLRPPTTPSAVQDWQGASQKRKQEKARTHLRSYRWREQEEITRPRPASRCHAARSTCDGLTAEQSSAHIKTFKGRLIGEVFKTKTCSHHTRCFQVAENQIGTVWTLTSIYRHLIIIKRWINCGVRFDREFFV